MLMKSWWRKSVPVFCPVELPMGQTEEHLQNHKAYVQSWIQGIKEQPDALFRAVKDAEQAAVYWNITVD